MSKTFKKIFALVLLVVMVVSLSACAKGDSKYLKGKEIPQTTDKMRTYYEIFPYSFADSNGDGVGDINGIIEKLDYIQDLNYDGIWLTPVHQSTTYHKYDVTDYYSIDKEFGTLEDYDRLVEECHKRGMTVLLDLVFNHTSDEIGRTDGKHNGWFDKAAMAFQYGKKDDPYYNFYNFDYYTNDASIPSGWEKYNSSLIYECRFWGKMPDLNLQEVLDNPNGNLAKELTNIMKFWLVDHKVDGFRLDAVTSYFTSNVTKNTEFMKWLNDTAKSIKPDCYIVGEGSWDNPSENTQYQSSGIDSFFAFQHGFRADGNLSFAVRLGKASFLSSIDEKNKTYAANGIPATFIANHDTARAYGIATAAISENNLKGIYGLMAMLYGTTFNYYGDEVGMAVLSAKGMEENSYEDKDKRQPMPWGDKYQCNPVKGSTTGSDEEKYPLGTVAEQLEDKNSVLNYVSRANAIRRLYPQIARNVAVEVYLNRERNLAVVSKGEGNSKIFIIWNANLLAEQTFDLSELDVQVKIGATLSMDVNKAPKISKNSITMPAGSFAILEIVD